MLFWQSLVIGLLQGATELFPVSSLGHAVVLPALLHWSYRESDPAFLPFLVLLHLGTAPGLLILYWPEWVLVVRGFFRAAMRGRLVEPEERLAMLLVAGTIPAGVIGVLLEKPLRSLFASPPTAAAFLLLNGLILLGAEVARRRDERRRRLGAARSQQEARYGDVEHLGFRAALAIGLCQSLALIPGISRSGATIAGGLFAGLRHTEAARFSFLLATPVIAAAGLLEIPQLSGTGAPIGQYAVAAVLAGIAAYLSARFLLRYFEVGRLDPYGYYCCAIGAASLVLLR